MMAHHIWCNFFMLPEEGCKMCEGLRKMYPEDCTPDELIAKYFPDVIVIKPTKEVVTRVYSDGTTESETA